MNIKSRILEFIPKDCMLELDAISRDVLIPDNNTKINKMSNVLTKYNVPFQELGPGTNRYAVFIDGYVFKFALDKDGKRDNLAEFSMSQELQPFVIKVYECNGLIIVTEYVTVISREEFMNSKDQIRETLSYLAEGYLLGDVGSITKNFVNWGYRDDGSLVILDFAYIYRILGNEMECGGLNRDDTICKELLEYDENFNNLVCPRCRKTYTFHDIRRKISKDYETKELNAIKQIAIKVTKPNQEVNVKQKSVEEPKVVETTDNNYGGNDMSKKHKKYYDDEYNREEDINEYLAAIEFMKKEYDKERHNCECECIPDESVNELVSTEEDETKEPLPEIVEETKDEERTYEEMYALDATDSIPPIEEASNNVEKDSDDKFESDPEEEDLVDVLDEEESNQEECEQVVNVLGAGVEFIDVQDSSDKNDEEEEKSDEEELEESSQDVLVLTDSDEEAEKLRQILIADNETLE